MRSSLLFAILVMMASCQRSPVHVVAADLPGTYHLEGRRGTDRLVLNPDGTYRHIVTEKDRQSSIGTGRWEARRDDDITNVRLHDFCVEPDPKSSQICKGGKKLDEWDLAVELHGKQIYLDVEGDLGVYYRKNER